MAKSLALSSNLGFDEFMKAVVRVHPEKPRPKKKAKKRRLKP